MWKTGNVSDEAIEVLKKGTYFGGDTPADVSNLVSNLDNTELKDFLNKVYTAVPAAIGATQLNQKAYGGQLNNNMKPISKQINQQYLPTIVGGYPVYAYGGKLYWGGGMMATDVQMQNIQAASQGVGPYAQQGLSQGASMGLNVAGQGMQDIANDYRPDKPNYGANIGGGALKGAGKGAMVGTAIMPGIGTLIGTGVGAIGGALSGWAKAGKQKREQEQLQSQQEQAFRQNMAKNLPGTPQYTPTFAMGGKINPSELSKGIKEEMEHTTSKKVSKKIAKDHLLEHPDYYTKLKKAGLAESYSMGSFMNNTNPSNLPVYDRLTEFKNGGSHEESKFGGIPVGSNALTEEGEFQYTTKSGEKYIFTDRF